MEPPDEEKLLRSAALQTSQSIRLVRQRTEQELLLAKQALEARSVELAHSLSIMRATLDSTWDGILVVDENGGVVDYNEQFVRLWNFPRDAVVAGSREPLLQLAAQQLKNPEQFRARTQEIHDSSSVESMDVLEFADGRVVERYSKVQRIEGRIAGRVWSYHDITERIRAETEREKLLVSEKEARERAERETRMKDEFLATLSHELRTPLNAILGWANILRSSSKPEDVADGIAVIERNARAQAEIIEDLLDMSRIISGKVRLDLQQIDLISLIEAALKSVDPMATAKEIAITSTLNPKAGSIFGDPARIQQVLWNLLTNALKFTPKGGRVEVGLEQVESHVEIDIADTGHGISAEFLPRVFDRFRQADASTTRRHGGLGLGLAIVKNLVELHGGSVRAESRGENQGATFTIALPLTAIRTEAEPAGPVRRAASAGESRQCPSDLTGLNILAVDDEQDARQLIKRLLTDCGAAVETAGSVAEALALLKSMKPDVLVTDIGMPGEDGYAFIRQVRARSAKDGGAVPAIALTAFAGAADRDRALQNGFQTHMAKPVEASELIATVAKLAGRGEGNLAHPEFTYE